MEKKKSAKDIKIWCVHSDLVRIEDLKPNPKNPNSHPQGQIEILAKVIQEQGWRQSIKVSKQSGYIVSGHGRYEAALFMGAEFVPVDYQDYESEDAELADLLADNRIAELAVMDNAKLAELFAGIDSAELELTGYTDDDISDISKALEVATMADIDEINSKSDANMHTLKFNHTVIPMTDDERKLLIDKLDEYVDINGVVHGFVGWLLNG